MLRGDYMCLQNKIKESWIGKWW